MAARKGTATVSGVSVGAGATVTIIQAVAAANHALRLERLSVTVDGDDPSAEMLTVDLQRQTTAGTMSALTPVKRDDSIADSFDSTWQKEATVEPTAGDQAASFPCNGQVGIPGEPLDWVVGAGDRTGIRVTNPTAVARTVSVSVDFEE